MDISATYFPSSDTLKPAAVILRGHPTENRQPVHMIFLVDISDSMNEDRKLSTVKRSMEFVLDLLGPDDLISVITFGSEADVVFRQMSATNKTMILNKVHSLKTNGYTNMSAALLRIRDCLDTHVSRHKLGALLLTDGHANRGVSDQAGLKTLVQRLIEDTPSLTLTTIGYGNDHQVDLLRDISTVGSGSYNVVYNLEAVATTFGEVLGGLTTVVAQNITVEIPEGCELTTGYSSVREPDGSFRVRVGDIYAENEVILLFKAPEGKRVRVRGHEMQTFRSIEQEILVEIPAPGAEIPKNLQLASFRYEVSQLLRESARGHPDTDEMKRKAESVLTRLRVLPYVSEQLVQMMIDDLESLLITYEQYDNILPPEMTTNISQHSAYLAMGRGMRSVMPPVAAAAAEVLGAGTGILRSRTANVDHMTSPFSNQAQMRNITVMRTASSQVEQ